MNAASAAILINALVVLDLPYHDVAEMLDVETGYVPPEFPAVWHVDARHPDGPGAPYTGTWVVGLIGAAGENLWPLVESAHACIEWRDSSNPGWVRKVACAWWTTVDAQLGFICETNPCGVWARFETPWWCERPMFDGDYLQWRARVYGRVSAWKELRAHCA